MEGHKRLSRLFSDNLPAMFIDVVFIDCSNSCSRLILKISFFLNYKLLDFQKYFSEWAAYSTF